MTPSVDYRLGGCPRYYMSDGSPLMYIPDVIKRCVVFLGCETKDGDFLGATAFFVGVHSTTLSKYRANYLVTARHTIDDIKKKIPSGRMFVRSNWHNKGAQATVCNCSDWIFHPTDRNVDVAVMPFTPNKFMEWGQIPNLFFLNKSIVDSEKIGIGDDLFMVGLFTNHYGKKRNIPIGRVGTIAAMPEEPLSLVRKVGRKEIPYNMDAYLIEARSIGGLSGSPVFVVTDYKQTDEIITKEVVRLKQRQSTFYFLGLIQGHFDDPYLKKDSMIQGKKGEGAINMGIGVVVPAEKILEVLNQPILAEQREKKINELIAKNSPVVDVSF